MRSAIASLLKRKSVDPESLDILRNEIRELDRWERLMKSEEGKFFAEWLDKAIEETIQDEDKADIYQMDQSKREYFFASVRSKRQTLNAIRNQMIKAKAEKEWRINELNKLTPEEGE